MADRYAEEARNAPGSGGWQYLKYLYHKALSDPHLFGESDAITGEAPSIGSVGKAGKAARILAQTAKEDKVLGIGRQVKNAVKQDKSFVTGDARHALSGQSRVKNNQIRLAIEQMGDPSYMPQFSRELSKLQTKLAKATNPEVITRIKGEIRDLAKRFIDSGYLH